MNPILFLVFQVLLSACISILVLWTMRRPLTRTLASLCPDAESAAFWWSYACVMLVIAPLVLVLIVDLVTPGDAMGVGKLRFALLACLCGLLLGLWELGQRIGQFVVLPAAAAKEVV